MVSESKLYYGVMRDMGYNPSNNVFQSLLDMFVRVSERLRYCLGGGAPVNRARGKASTQVGCFLAAVTFCLPSSVFCILLFAFGVGLHLISCEPNMTT